MKILSNNKKGFTLIELLAVIVILAILVMLAIPMVTRYLTTARKNAFADNALRAVEAVRNDIVTGGFSENSITREAGDCSGNVCYYDLDEINKLLDTKLTTSPFGNGYTGDSAGVCIKVEQTSGGKYTMSMVDDGGNGFVDLVAGSADSDESIIANNVDETGQTAITSASTATKACAAS